MFLSKNKNTRGRYYIYYKDDKGKRKAVSTITAYKNEALAFLITFANKRSGNKLVYKLVTYW
jgi:hypothetical protein